MNVKTIPNVPSTRVIYSSCDKGNMLLQEGKKLEIKELSPQSRINNKKLFASSKNGIKLPSLDKSVNGVISINVDLNDAI